MGCKDGWGQTWSHTSLGKCERHRTLVGIHLLTIKRQKGFFYPIWRILEKAPMGVMGGGKGWGRFKLLSLVFVCHAWDI